MKMFAAVCLFLVVACNSPFTPKPKGFFKIGMPEKQYRVFDEAGYPYSFEYPVYGSVVKDTSFFGEAPENPWWINIGFPQFEGKLYISYKEVGEYSLNKLVNDAFTLTNKHTMKAYAINDSLFTTANGVHGVFFTVEGNVATANQFFLTDSTKHFLRGALYFDATPNQDSLLPVQNFLMEDVKHLINTFRWK